MNYKDIVVGMVEEISHTITKKDISDFVNLTGDDNRLHVDPKYAANTKFKKPVAHGMLGASFISTVIGTKIPGDGALWFSQSLEFIMPVREGDVITVRATVISKDDSEKIVELKTEIFNQHRQKVTTGFAKVKVIEQDEDPIKNLAPETSPKRKVVLVIGGSGGIGSASCVALAKAGFDVVIHYHKNGDAADSVKEDVISHDVNACTWRCDITKEDDVKSMISGLNRRIGPISILVNCSTPTIPAIKFNELLWQDFQVHLDNQVKGMLHLVQAVLPHMEAEKFGKIIQIDTKYIDAPESNMIPYITAKSAIRGFSKALANDLGPKGILVNTIGPGMTDTDLISEVPARQRMVLAAKTPLRRLGTPQDIAKVVVFLASNDSNYLCGETIRVNGGQVML